MSVATTEPSEIIAGTSAIWEITNTDYPATSHALRYVLRKLDGQGGAIQLDSTSSGTAHKVSLSTATTASWTAGAYRFYAFARDTATSGATTNVKIREGNIQVLPDPAAENLGDQRSYTAQVLAELEAAYLRLSGNTVSNASANGKSYTKRDLTDLRVEIAHWRHVANEEKQAQARANGDTTAGVHVVRFNPQV